VEESADCPLAHILAERLRLSRDDLTLRWLERISARVTLDPGRIFPSKDLLDHVPLLVDGIANYLEDAADEISASAPVTAKAMELGELRLSQGFGAHEILKEYEILGGVLFSFLIQTVDSIEVNCARSELLACAHRLFRGISVIQQATTNQYLRVAEEQVKEREERLRSFNRMVSHELKNRIAAMSGASEMLNEPFIDQDEMERRRFREIIQRSIAGMNAVLKDLLTLSRMDASSRQQRNVMLPEAVAEAAHQLREMADEADVEIRIADDMPRVEVNAAAIELCMVNFISNGIKYADPAQSVRWVHIFAYPTSETPDGEVTVEVRDNGLGIRVDTQNRLFERFYRIDSPSHTDGTGLGLSIVRETVEGLGGRAWFDFPEDGVGASFKIAFPARRAADHAEMEEATVVRVL